MKKPAAMPLPQRLDACFKRMEIKTWREAANFLGVTESFLSEIMRGLKSGERQTINFALCLEVPVEYLLGKNYPTPWPVD